MKQKFAFGYAVLMFSGFLGLMTVAVMGDMPERDAQVLLAVLGPAFIGSLVLLAAVAGFLMADRD